MVTMEADTVNPNTYEGMYIFDPAAATEWPAVEGEVKRLMERASANLMYCHRWDDRRLAYEIKGRKRGCYVLTYFTAPPASLDSLQRDAELSDMVLRALFLRADTVSKEQMENPPKPGSDSPRGRGGDRWEREEQDRRDRERRPRFAGDTRRSEHREKQADAGAPEPAESAS